MKLNEKLFQEIAQSQSKILLVTKYWDKNQTEKCIQEAQEKFPQIFIGVGENRVESLAEKKLPKNLVHFIGRVQSKSIPKILEYSSVIHSLDSVKHAQKIQNYLEKNNTNKSPLLKGDLGGFSLKQLEDVNEPVTPLPRGEAGRGAINTFLQIALDPQKPSGIPIEKLPDFLEAIKNFDRIKVIGISGMGRGQFTQEEKIEEFQILKKAQKILEKNSDSISPLDKGGLGDFSKGLKALNEPITPLPQGEVGRGVENFLISAGTSRDYQLALQQKIHIVRIGQKGVINVQ